MWWTMILEFIKKPTVAIIIALVVMCGGLYINNSIQDVKINKLHVKIDHLNVVITGVKNNFNTCKINETTLLESIDACNHQADIWASRNDTIKKQLLLSELQVKKWQTMYDEKECYNNDDETVVIPSEKKVICDEQSNKVVNDINSIFID